MEGDAIGSQLTSSEHRGRATIAGLVAKVVEGLA
jgi:hypothetical protein